MTVRDHATRVDERSTDEPPHEVPWPFVERRKNTEDRRKTTVRSILYGAFRPRRRAGRRASDQHFPIDWHDPYLLCLTFLMLALSVTDAFMTITLLNDGGTETNALLAFVLDEHPRLFAAVKMGLTGSSIVVLVALARSRLFGIVSGRAIFQALTLAYMTLVAYEGWLVSLMS